MKSLALALAPLALVTLFGAAGCSAETAPEDDGVDTSEDNLTASKACGSNYAKANALYVEAVNLSKKYNADRCGADVYQEQIVTKLKGAISTCESFRAVYTNSTWAAPARKALAGNIEDGLLRGKGAVEAVRGATFFSRKPGAIQPEIITLGTDGKATRTSYVTPGKEGTAVKKTTTYSIAQPRCMPSASCPTLVITYGDGGAQQLFTHEAEYILVPSTFDPAKNASEIWTSPSVFSNYEDACSA